MTLCPLLHRRFLLTALTLLTVGSFACRPGSYRPAYGPLPGAFHVEVRTASDSVLVTVVDSLRAQPGLQIARMRFDEGYLETTWYDTLAQRSGPLRPTRLAHSVRFRFWTDPADPGTIRVTGEATRVVTFDPSREERSLERLVPEGHFGERLVYRILDALRAQYGG